MEFNREMSPTQPPIRCSWALIVMCLPGVSRQAPTPTGLESPSIPAVSMAVMTGVLSVQCDPWPIHSDVSSSWPLSGSGWWPLSGEAARLSFI